MKPEKGMFLDRTTEVEATSSYLLQIEKSRRS